MDNVFNRRLFPIPSKHAVFKKINNSVFETNLAELKSVLFPIYTESYHVTNAFPTLPIFLTIR